jgi:hypothetical protein
VPIRRERPSPKRRVVFSTKDVLGNEVTLHQSTWEDHIAIDHPEIAALQRQILPAIIDPARIRESTDAVVGATSLVFENTVAGLPPEDLLRVVVRYSDTGYMQGGSTGVVVTAFPRNPKRYKHAKVGAVKYSRASTDRASTDKGGIQ